MAVFAGWKIGRRVAYISASHLPPEWNGIKFSESDGTTSPSSIIEQLREKVSSTDAPAVPHRGKYEKIDIKPDYISFLLKKLKPAEVTLHVLVDCGNGTSAIIAPELLSLLGYKVTPLFSELDGNFPNRPSEIDEEALQPALRYMKGHDVGVAYDGDSDRMTLILAEGKILDAEQTSAIILHELLKTREGDIVVNTGCGRVIEFVASRYGRKIIRVPVGTAYMLRKVKETNAAFGVESSMHMCIPDLLPFDDAVAVSAYAMYAVSRLKAKSSSALNELIDELPRVVKRKENITVSDDIKFKIMDTIRDYAISNYSSVDLIDGVRINFEGGWIQVRASDTSPMIRIFVEANANEIAEEWIKKFTRFFSGEKK
jgi:phosphomannomutase